MTSVPPTDPCKLQPPTADDVRRLREKIPDHEVAAAFDALARLLWAGAQAQAKRDEAAAVPEPAPLKPKRRTPRPSPSRLAKWEAAWQAEQPDDEGDA